MEIGEIIAAPVLHNEPNEECPFCPTPADNEKPFTTHPGSAKNSTRLAEIMEKPNLLVEKESNARPKQGQENQQQASSAKPAPTPLQHPTFGDYTYEAHHLIPGKELVEPGSSEAVMSGHQIEKWIIKGDKVDRDTGYSINNSDNGTWLPSATAANKKNPANKTPARPWASEAKTKNNPAALTVAEKTSIAEHAMIAGAGQFHYGQHKILDEDGVHYSYTKEVKDRLGKLEQHLAGWSKACLCDKQQKNPPHPPFKPTWKVNEKLDLLSKWIEIDIRLMPPGTWRYFISTWAKNLAARVGSHVNL